LTRTGLLMEGLRAALGKHQIRFITGAFKSTAQVTGRRVRGLELIFRRDAY